MDYEKIFPLPFFISSAILFVICLLFELSGHLIFLRDAMGKGKMYKTSHWVLAVYPATLWVISVIAPIWIVLAFPGTSDYDTKRWLANVGAYIIAIGFPTAGYIRFKLLKFGALSSAIKIAFISMFLFVTTGCGGIFDEHLSIFEWMW